MAEPYQRPRGNLWSRRSGGVQPQDVEAGGRLFLLIPCEGKRFSERADGWPFELLCDPTLEQRLERLMSIDGVGPITALISGAGSGSALSRRGVAPSPSPELSARRGLQPW